MGKSSIFGNKENRLFLKILSYFLSLLVPIVIIGISTNMYSVHIMKKDFNERITTNLQNAVNSVDTNMEAAQETSLDFFNDDMVRMLFMPKAQQSLEIKTEIWRLPKIIQRNENVVSHFTDRMFAYIDDQEVYVSGGVNRFDSFFGSMYRYDKYDTAYWAKKLTSDKYIELLPVATIKQEGIHEKQVIPIVIKDRVQNHTAIMVLNIAVDAIEKTLKGNTVFDSTGFAVIDGYGEALYDPAGYLQDAVFTQQLKLQEEGAAATDELKLNGTKYEVSRAQSSLYGWKYYSFTPASEFNKHTFSILQMTLLLCLVLMVMGVAFSFIFSFRIYSPIRNIRNIVADKSDMWSGDNVAAKPANEFEQIQQGIRRLTDHHMEYKMKYDKHTNEYVQSSFLFLLKGHTLNQEEILRETLKAEFGFDRAGFVCCTVFFDLKEAFYRDIQDTDRMYVMNGIKKIVWTLLGEQAPSYVLEYRHNLFVGIVNLERPEETELLYQAFQKLLGLFQFDIHMYYDMTIGIGTFYTGVNEIGASYNEAMTAVEKRNKEERFQIVDSKQLLIENRFVYSFSEEQKILNHLKLGDAAGLQAIIDDIVAANLQRSISYEYLLLLFKELYMTGTRFLAERGVDARHLEFGDSLSLLADTSRVNSFIGTKELLAETQAFYRKIIETTRPDNAPKAGSLVSTIEKYIQENYTRDLGLEQIAAEMGVSDKYVSRVFKDKTGVNLTDYINQLRLEKAKELLAQTDMRVNDIAEQIGIHSRTTFLRVFKKMEGVSPNDYRSIHRKMGQPPPTA
ncbi:helix-turn-helix domain-containing protein [Paenibacillus thalictri]|uniref:AraC family transcriptional regulator n=1 Tax=Paenibacillus thalictri TaxID=2527873 RepID=A0A4Q9DVU4_9BACL|nr:helix-turn-helix domain-containing protein [Paenibacillus thalictri]TBL80109.1 AraC family transcriptional regulator [Paenibacillus thalictri]